MAEHREIIRIPNAIAAGRLSAVGKPDVFCLGKGHVKFFCDKLYYLQRRYYALYDECVRRGYNVTPFHNCFANAVGDYAPTQADFKLISARLLERGWLLDQKRVYYI